MGGKHLNTISKQLVYMPTIRIDDNAHEILKEIKNNLKKKRINATFSDAIRWLYENAKIRKEGSNAG